jgi:hydroxymethylpyrimidine/phosphomethylpyrimidine kinase
MTRTPQQPVALTIAGSDSGGNAGIQADLRAFHVFSVHGCTAITALTAQNPHGVTSILNADPAFLKRQLDAIFEDYQVGAIKTGMLSNAELIHVVAQKLADFPAIPKVIDPVMVATSGARLLADNAVNMMQQELLPLATLITPNMPEAAALTGQSAASIHESANIAATLASRYGCAVLIKGGHDTTHKAVDILHIDGKLYTIATPAVEAPLSTHGTGCSLSAAIAAALANGRTLLDAVREGKAYIYEAIRTGCYVGKEAAVLGTPKQLPLDAVTVQLL